MRGFGRRISGWEVLRTSGAARPEKVGGDSVAHHDGTIVSTVEDGVPLVWFVANPNDVIQSKHMRGGFYEQEELNVIASLYKGGVFVDIGANVGNHAIFAARNLKAPKVICFEPNPSAYELLKLNFRLNELSPTLDLRTVGLSDQIARLPHSASANNLGDGRFCADAIKGDQTLQVLVGDDELRGVDVGFVKVDVEGMELRVLGGLQRLIQRSKPPMFIEVDAANDHAFKEFVSGMGYRVVQTCRRYSGNCNYAIAAS